MAPRHEAELRKRLTSCCSSAHQQPLSAALAQLAVDAAECLPGVSVDIALIQPDEGLGRSDAPNGSFQVPVIVRGRTVAVVELRRSDNAGSADSAARCAVLIAGAAATVVDRARTTVESARRERWSSGAASLARDLMEATSTLLFDLVAERTAEVAEADVVSILQPSSGASALTVTVSAGKPPPELMVGSEIDGLTSVAATALTAGRALSIAQWDAGEHVPPVGVATRRRPQPRIPDWTSGSALGNVLVVPLVGIDARAVLIIGRRRHRAPFTAGEVGAASGFASQVVLALELAESRERRAGLQLMEERDRLSHELQDEVIQRLFAVGLCLQRASADVTGSAALRVQESIEGIDDTITQVRTTIRHLNQHYRRATTGASSIDP